VADPSTPVSEWLPDARRLLTDVPTSTTLPEHLLIRRLLAQLVAQVVGHADVMQHPAVARAALMLAIEHSTTETLRVEFDALIDRAALLSAPARPRYRHRALDPHVGRSLAVIEARHREPRLSLRDVASTVNLSPWHLTRLLKRATGGGFVTHVHRVRISAAERLLRDTSLTVKQVAAAVGYANTSQLDRHFRCLRGTTPVSFRRRATSSKN
jgi:transcriptional regulator GlxA family with amidase domain